MRAITNDDINAAARGLGLWGMTEQELQAKVDLPAPIDLFASQVIAGAARQVLLARRSMRRGVS